MVFILTKLLYKPILKALDERKRKISESLKLADSLKTALLKVDPFRNYPAYINVHRVNVDDTSLALARVPVEVGEAIACNFDKALAYGALAPDCDLAVVLCNVTKVRSTGGGSPGP